METVTQGQFASALNNHYSERGYECSTLQGAKRYLEARKFKKVGKNIYRNDRYRLAFLTSLRDAKFDYEREVIFKPAGWLITFNGNQPISHTDCVFRVKSQ